VTEEFAYDLGSLSFCAAKNPTVRYFSAVTDVFELQIHLAKVQ